MLNKWINKLRKVLKKLAMLEKMINPQTKFYDDKKMLGILIDFYLNQMKNNNKFFDIHYVSEFLMVLVSVNVAEKCYLWIALFKAFLMVKYILL